MTVVAVERALKQSLCEVNGGKQDKKGTACEASPMFPSNSRHVVAVTLSPGGNHTLDINGGTPRTGQAARPFKNWPM